jgi:tripartite motif-containing protein 71
VPGTLIALCVWACLSLALACGPARAAPTTREDLAPVPGASSPQVEACPGSGPAPCPYAQAATIGQRGEGVLRFPEAVAVDTEGDVYVADQLGYVVQEFTAAGQFEMQWGSYGAGPGQFGPISGLAVDASGDVYVVDASHDRIEKFGPDGEYITQWGSRGSGLGEFNFGSSQTPSQPPGGGIAVAGDHVYVADSGNDRVERFNLEGGEPLAWGTDGSGPGQFDYPRAVAANESEVIVSDDDNHRIEKFNTEGAWEGEAGSPGDGPGEFAFPYGVALDAAGDVFVADDSNDRVVKLTPQLRFSGAWGGVGSKPGQLDFPRALASDPAGDTYVADTANDRIEVFDPEGSYLRSFGVSGRGPGELTAPTGLAVQPEGQLLVADTVDGRIARFAAGSDAYLGQWTLAGGVDAGFSSPAGIAVDPAGSVYVADTGNTRLVHLWGEGAYLGEVGGPAEVGGAQLAGAGAVAVSPLTHQTYVADTDHNRILVYGPEGNMQAKWGAEGANGAAGSGAAGFDHPEGVAVAHDGDVYVSDTGNDRVVELSPGGAELAEWGSKGGADGRFRFPVGIAVASSPEGDAAGEVYVVDSQNNRVQVFTPEGRFLYKWGLRGVGLGAFSQPTAIAVGCEGDVYVADTNNNRVQRFQMDAPTGSGCLAAGTWPPPPNVPPVLRVTVPPSANVLSSRALTLAVSCKRNCRVLVTATLSPLRHSRSVPLIAAARPLRAQTAARVRLPLGPSALGRLRRALGRSGVLRAHVQVVAASPTGLRTTVTRTYLLRR